MDESTVRQRAEAHGQAMVDGDLTRAAGDLSPEALAGVGTVMRELPRELTGAEIVSVDAEGDAMVCKIRYSSAERDVVVASHWEDVGGELKIARLDLDAG